MVILPSAFAGGEMVIEHHDEQLIVRGSRRGLTLAAFYADCHHQVRPVTRGYRVALTWNVVLAGGAVTTAMTPAGQIDRLAEQVHRVFETPPEPRWASDTRREPPDRLVYLLDHQYTQRSLSWSGLKNGDAVRAAALRTVARRLDCEIGLALADVHETWSCEDEDVGWRGRYGHRRRRSWRDDDDEAADSGAHILVDLMDADVELRHWIGSGRRPEALREPVGDHELCYTKASRDLEPFKSEHEGYMGNWGNTVDRCTTGPPSCCGRVNGPSSSGRARRPSGPSGKSSGRSTPMISMVPGGWSIACGPFWDRTVGTEPRRGLLDRTLMVAVRLDDRDRAATLLHPFDLTQLTATASRRLAALLAHYGLAWCRALLGQWASARRDGPDARTTWIRSTLPDVCGTLCSAGGEDGIALSQWLIRQLWTSVSAQRQEALTHTHPRRLVEALTRLSAPALALIESTIIASSADLHDEIVRTLASGDANPVEAHVHLLRTTYEGYPRAAWPRLGLGPIHAAAVADLTARLEAPPRARDDWSMTASIRCTCRLCGTLTTFLRAPGQSRLEWPLAKDQRRHIHAALERYGLPVTHTTRRTGRPFTLVLEKAQALFEGDAAARRSWQRDRQWLAKTARAFAT